MAAILVVTHLLDNNGVPADDTLNTFVFQAEAAAATLTALTNGAVSNLLDFYNVAAPGAGNSIGQFLGSNLQRTLNNHFTIYRLADAGSTTPVLPLGGPINDIAWTTPLPAVLGTGDLPREVAAVLSYQDGTSGISEDVPGGPVGPAGDTHPAARHRGRIYVGPLNNAALGAGANGPGLNVSFRTAATQAARQLTENMTNLDLSGIIGTGTMLANWGIWSRKDHIIRGIEHGWMDDAFDTQRRRGIKATARTTF